MALESTMIWCAYDIIFFSLKIFTLKFISLDNSDWMRNGDYLPSRLDAQQDAGEANLFYIIIE